MLQSLYIKNYALIESLEINFSSNFSIITGETGAGKSILLGALGLVLGNRADLSALKDKEQKCVIEAHFSISNYNLKQLFESLDLDYDDNTIIRREILPTGKSRAFVNDSPVNLSELQELGNYLIDIHSQFQTREIINEEYQINLLDKVANNENAIQLFQGELKTFKSLQSELKKIVSEKEVLGKEQEYNLFLFEELEKAKLKIGEQEELELESEKLNNIEFLKENISKVISISNQEEIGLLANLNEVKSSLQKIASISTEFNDLHERISVSLIEIEDIIAENESLAEKLIDDPSRTELVNNKLQSLYNLQKKHQVNTIEELLQIQENLEQKVVKFDDIDSMIKNLENQITTSVESLDKKATIITDARKKASITFIEKVTQIITQLGMPDAQFEFEITPTETYNKFGKDQINLLFSANKGSKLEPIKKVASGGEMSRLMLAIKGVLTDYSKLPTIIFDEIDTGVSGEIALKMAEIMKVMSNKMQVFAITHLPQIASKGNQHYKVFKITQNNDTISEIKLLTDNERVVEIAEMLSGKDISESAINHAKALLN
ncbi:DNA repair protein RecN [uncultured Flavobacterium sp.]|uniref:DNA repair protein RecN n=1 Tax=uncultured Flavobacterium sp. TaxID=165435 RepID=UPI0030EECABB|tara:strand:- start:1732 stop:3384 length:1653 start_codon:yes stop_codon:yes gene_type:complete